MILKSNLGHLQLGVCQHLLKLGVIHHLLLLYQVHEMVQLVLVGSVAERVEPVILPRQVPFPV